MVADIGLDRMKQWQPAVFTARTPQDLYQRQLLYLLVEGSFVKVRERNTFEIQNAITVIEQPWQRVLAIPGRRWNPWLALSECLFLVAGRNDVAALKPYNKKISDYSDDGKTFYGAYGRRIKDQIPGLLERFRRDRTDRRVNLVVWNETDLLADTKDPPCNDFVMFKIRDGQLNMTVTNRSNDIHWGLYAANLPEFSFLQEMLAGVLGVKQGWQCHLSNSLHVYLDDSSQEITDRMEQRIEEQVLLPVGMPIMQGCENYLQFISDADFVLDGDQYRGLPFLEFASDFLRAYREKDWELASVRHAEDHQDWIFSARYWRQER